MSPSLPVEDTTTRRSANYQPSIWSYEYIQSLGSSNVRESFSKRLEKLKEEVRMVLTDTVEDPLHQLELIDTLQRLGVSYHFEDEIKSILTIIHGNYKELQDSLYAVALEFRLLRQHGFDISTEIFSNFRDEKGNFKSCLGEDCKGILYLYEAAYLLEEGEDSLFHDVRNFTTTFLNEYVKQNSEDDYLSTLVNHALQLQLHWRMLRLEARWFIDVYGRRKDMNPLLLEFAKLDFNVVQALHLEDLKNLSRWWRNTSLGDHEQFSFARNHLMECFLWALGSLFEPKFGYCRGIVTKVTALVTVIDDIYDVYGTMDELELFTDAIERWDVNAMEQLPHYMRICFLALHNSINEIAFDALKEQGVNIIPYLKKEWANLCKSYLLEAKWYNSGYIPTLGEFLDNALVSIGAPLALSHVYYFITNSTGKEASERLKEYHNIIRCISLVMRLADDLATSSDELQRGDVPKSIQCYMNETGASEEDARKHIQELITAMWMKINKERGASCDNAFIDFGRNSLRMALCIYQYGDGYAIEDRKIKKNVLSLLVNPISLTNTD